MSKTYRIVSVVLLVEEGTGDEAYMSGLDALRDDVDAVVEWGTLQPHIMSTGTLRGLDRLKARERWEAMSGQKLAALGPPPIPKGHISPEEVIRYCRAADETQVCSQTCGITLTREGRLGITYVGPNGRDTYFEGVSAAKTPRGLSIFGPVDSTQNAARVLEVRLLQAVHPDQLALE